MEPSPTDIPKILLLDDDESTLQALKDTISIGGGYHVIETTSPHMALEFLKENRFSVIISDQRMPEMTGLEFLEKAKGLQPIASRILITGVLTLNTVIDAVNEGEIFRFIAKPWVPEELLATMKNAVQRFQLLISNQKLQADTLQLNEQLSHSNLELKQKNRALIEHEAELDAANAALKSNFDHSLDLCYRIINAYHPLLGKETKSIVDLCRQMNSTGDLTARDQNTLVVSAWLQNIGLIGVSRDLLVKSRQEPDALSEAEGEIIRNHPVYGQTLASFVDHLEGVGATIRAHHERWDGKGYPDRLSRETIPKPARVLAVAVYFVECGLSKEEAIESILQESGRAFEPESVRLFLKATRMVKLPRRVAEVLFEELKEGMVLAKGLFSPTGLLLIPEESTLSDKVLEKIKRHNLVDPFCQRFLVYHGS